MIYFLVGAASLVVGAVFFWLNITTPIQTRIPAFALPIGAALLLIGLGRVLP